MTHSSRVPILLALALTASCGPKAKGPAPAEPTSAPATQPAEPDVTEAGFAKWVEAHVARVRPVRQAANEAYWKATASGKKEDYDASADAQLAYVKAYSDRADFAYLKAVRAAGNVKDPVLARQLEIVYLAYLGNQFDPALQEQIVRLGADIESRFNTYRAEVDGKKLTDNDVEGVLKDSKDSAARKKTWEASKGIGATIDKDVIKLVKLRNEAAKQLGYPSYYVLALALGEQDEGELFALLDDMAARTDAPFAEVKGKVDTALAKRYRIKPADLRPWHYEDRFFQETPSVGSVDLEAYYKGTDVVELALQFFDSVGLPARKVIERSDVLGREGKYQHAYCTDIDRAGDVRVMGSAVPSLRWMDTMLHELGHAVYALGYDENPAVPFLLRDAAHSFTTEGIAMLSGALASNPYWMKRFVGMKDADVKKLAPQLRARSRLGHLVFARWCLVMANFERELYKNPDQDLNALWWRLVAKYQLVTPPEGRNAPDWASKIHIVSYPAYYHNYLLGDLYATQLHAAITEKFFPGQDPYMVIYADKPELGTFLHDVVFWPGQLVRWDKFVVDTTGKPLGADAFGAAYAK